jgi:hypothetical protein
MHSRFRPPSQDLPTYTLHHGRARTVLVRLVPDPVHPNMWAVRLPDGTTSDIANLARAKDAAAEICLRGQPKLDWRLLHWKHDQPDVPREAPPVRLNGGAVSNPGARPRINLRGH